MASFIFRDGLVTVSDRKSIAFLVLLAKLRPLCLEIAQDIVLNLFMFINLIFISH